MKCPYCGYDKIQPNFNFCPKCKRFLKDQNGTKQVLEQEDPHPQEKGFINRAFSRWTYERAMADPYAYAIWAYRNPNDNRVFLERWNKDGNDLTVIRQAISEANRARQENPTVDQSEVDANIIGANQQNSRRQSNNSFVQAVNEDYTADAASIVRNKAIWKLQPGELARHIAPDEWVYVSEHLEGLVIEEGTSAIVYVDGQEVAQMGSGMYVFDNKHIAAAEMEAERRKNERQGFFSSLADGIYRFFTGHKREESTQQRDERRRRIQQIMGRLRKDTIIDVYLKSDRVFPAIFGHQHYPDSTEGYQPYIIQSRYLDVAVGVSVNMQIADFKEFIAHYFAGRKSVTIADVIKSVDGAVLSVLRYRLRDIEVAERGLDEDTFNAIRIHLMRNLPNLLYGISLIDVLDIATSNEDLSRFRKVEERLYCSEREYDFLLRTNEFRNRIASEENDQKIREARSEQELRFRLDEVNKDQLLHDDEMEQFVDLLMNQKIIRETGNAADLDKALFDIERNRLIAKEEFDIFKSDLDNRTFDRDQVSEQLRARSLMATALQYIEVTKTMRIAAIQASDEVSDVKWDAIRKEKGRDAESWDLEAAIYGRKYVLERQQLVDNIERRRLENEAGAEILSGLRQHGDFERGETLKNHEVFKKIDDDLYQRELREKEDELRLIREEIEMQQSAQDHASKRALESLRAVKEMELDELKEAHSHDLEKEKIKADTERLKIQVEGSMTSDQWLGKNISQMDAGAQAKFAESFSHLNEVEITKINAAEREKLYQQMLLMAETNNINMRDIHSANAKQQVDIMREMMQAFTAMNTAASGGQQNVVNSMIGAMQNFANTRFNDAKDIKEEYRAQMQHEQTRVDKNQDQSLNYTTRVKVSENMPNFVGGTSVNVRVAPNVCPGCGQRIEDDILCCPICGRDLK